MELYSELQSNPRNQAIYGKLVEHYKVHNMLNEADAFLELIRKKFHADRPSVDEKQPSHNTEGS